MTATEVGVELAALEAGEWLAAAAFTMPRSGHLPGARGPREAAADDRCGAPDAQRRPRGEALRPGAADLRLRPAPDRSCGARSGLRVGRAALTRRPCHGCAPARPTPRGRRPAGGHARAASRPAGPRATWSRGSRAAPRGRRSSTSVSGSAAPRYSMFSGRSPRTLASGPSTARMTSARLMSSRGPRQRVATHRSPLAAHDAGVLELQQDRLEELGGDVLGLRDAIRRDGRVHGRGQLGGGAGGVVGLGGDPHAPPIVHHPDRKCRAGRRWSSSPHHGRLGGLPADAVASTGSIPDGRASPGPQGVEHDDRDASAVPSAVGDVPQHRPGAHGRLVDRRPRGCHGPGAAAGGLADVRNAVGSSSHRHRRHQRRSGSSPSHSRPARRRPRAAWPGRAWSSRSPRRSGAWGS